MKKYHKISGLYKREAERPHNLIMGVYREPEIELLKNIDWVFTEKIDGTGIRIMWDGHKVTIGGRTDNAQIPATLYAKLSDMFLGSINEEVFEEVFGNTEACLFGEGYGAKIQSGGNYIKDGVDFILFDVTVGAWTLKREDVGVMADKFDLKTVPIVGSGKLEKGIELVKNNLKSYFGDFTVEGIVARPAVELRNRAGERIIVKIKCKDFK